MKVTISFLAAGLAVAAAATPAAAFGRGVAVGGAAVGPAGGVRTASAAHGVSTGPFGATQATAVQSSSRTGPGGTSVQHVGGTSVTRGPLGGVDASTGGATRVTGPGGATYTRAGGANVGAGPVGGVRVGGASAAAVRTPGGSVAYGTRGGVAVGHTTTYVSPNTVRASAAVARGGFANPVFTPRYYQTHTTAWVAPRVVGGVSYWRPPVWGTTAAFVGVTTAPFLYDYGSTVVIESNTVYVNGDPVATAADYAAQAVQLADTGRRAKPAETDEWEPLGVFGAIQDDEKTAQRIFQLAVNKAGVVRGNYYDAVADNNLPVAGAIDPKTQRVAWSIGDKKSIVFETGLANLTKDESTLLVHYGPDTTQQMVLVRLEEPKDGK